MAPLSWDKLSAASDSDRVGIKRGYGRTDGHADGQADGRTKRINADADKRDKMRMRTKGIKCGCGQKG